MGLREKLEKAANKFSPHDLNDSNVQTIFNRVLATDESEHPLGLGLYTDDTSSDIMFDADELEKNYKIIQYIFGQLNVVHNQTKKFDITELIKKYDDTLWTTDKSTLMKFMYLSISIRLMSSLKMNDSSLSLFRTAKPTFMPTDPNFEKWYAEHKAEWED